MILELGRKDKDAVPFGTCLQARTKTRGCAWGRCIWRAGCFSRNKDAQAATAVYEAFDKKLCTATSWVGLGGLREGQVRQRRLSAVVDSQQDRRCRGRCTVIGANG